MGIDRREFLRRAAIAGITLIGGSSPAYAKNIDKDTILSTGNIANERNWKLYEKTHATITKEPYGILVDTTRCIGCRRCEWACNEWNKNPNKPIAEFEKSVVGKDDAFKNIRRMHAGNFTVVNRFYSSKDGKPIYVKRHCMHCEDPGCLASCFVDSYRKASMGPVLYLPHICVGCRYCMVACPFDVPAFEYYEALNPQITKCTMCYDRIISEVVELPAGSRRPSSAVPTCVEICPAEVMTFGKRSELINLAHERIRNNPGKYIDYVYGEQEVGGTSWMYLSSVPFEEIGFRTDIGKTPIPNYSRSFLFGVKMFEIVGAWPLVFGAYYAISKAREKHQSSHDTSSEEKGESHGAKH